MNTISFLILISGWVAAFTINRIWYNRCKSIIEEWYEATIQIIDILTEASEVE